MGADRKAGPPPADAGLVAATARAFGGRVDETRGMSIAQMASYTVAAAGTQKAAAAALGVNVATLRRWSSGQVHTPRGGGAPLRRAATAAIRERRMGPRTQRRLRGSPPWSAHGTVKVSSDARDRTIQPGAKLPEDSLGPALDAYLSGDDQGAGDAIASAVWAYMPGMTVEGDVTISTTGNTR